MQESADLRDFITQRYDQLGLEQAWSRQEGALIIGTDPTEWIGGYENIVGYLQRIVRDFEGMSLVYDDDLRAFTDGPLGWAAGHVNFRFEDGRDVPARYTGVYRKEGDEWTTIHIHVSIGIPDEEAFA